MYQRFLKKVVLQGSKDYYALFISRFEDFCLLMQWARSAD